MVLRNKHRRSRRGDALALAVVVASLLAYVPFAPLRLYDFRAFYCAGSATLAHADPYREHPLHDCERQTSATEMPPNTLDVTVPAPFPGYVLGMFALLARLPYRLCARAWIVVSILAVIATAELLCRSIDVSRVATLIVVGVPAAIVAIPLGQITPLVGLGIAICAYGLQTRHAHVAAFGALVTALDPPVSLAIFSALFIAARPTRLWLLIGVASLAAISLGTLGLPINIEYLSTVLHGHALANVMERTQFSTAHFAWAAGLSPSAALTLGGIWFGSSVAAGIWFALRLRRDYGDTALALVPPAFAVFGGIYVHYQQVALSIPAFLLLAARPSQTKSWLCVGIFVLAIPWLAVAAFPVFAIAIVILAVTFSRSLDLEKLGYYLGVPCAIAVLISFGVAVARFLPDAGTVRATVSGNPLAEESWGKYVASRDQRPEPLILFLQMPTVLALTSGVFGLVRASAVRPSQAVAAQAVQTEAADVDGGADAFGRC